MGWLIALGVLLLLAVLPLGVRFLYNSDGPLLQLLFGPFRFKVFPSDKERPKKNKPKKQVKKNKGKKTSKKKGGRLSDFMPLVRTALDFFGDFRRKLRIRRLELNLVLGGGDPCDLAINYGKTWTAVGNFMPVLERWFVIKKRDVEVECDFTASKTLVTARMDLTITLGRMLAAVCKFALRALKEYLNIMKKRKGGAST